MRTTIPEDRVLIATSTVADGNMSFRLGDADTVVRNREVFLLKHGIEFSDHVPMRCEHKDTVTIVDDRSSGRAARRRGESLISEVLITKEHGLALMLLTGDCIPAVLYDPKHDVVVLAHLNRRTIAFDLVSKVVQTLTRNFDTHPKDLLVYFGPHIHKASYAFPITEMKDPVPKALEECIEERDGIAYIDITRAHIKRFVECGVLSEAVEVSEIDTAVSNEYYSYYQAKRDPNVTDGRFATIAMLR